MLGNVITACSCLFGFENEGCFAPSSRLNDKTSHESQVFAHRHTMMSNSCAHKVNAQDFDTFVVFFPSKHHYNFFDPPGPFS